MVGRWEPDVAVLVVAERKRSVMKVATLNGTDLTGEEPKGENFEREVMQARFKDCNILDSCSSAAPDRGEGRGYWIGRTMSMSDVEKARRLFEEAGLAFPSIPEALAAGVKEQGKWLFSTREVEESPYGLRHYVLEVDGTQVEDYVVLCHSGHGVNSYAIQYYLVYGSLRIFLFLGWGGWYMNNDTQVSQIMECFSLADQIVPAATSMRKRGADGRLTIVGSDFYGSFWTASDQGSNQNLDELVQVHASLALRRICKRPAQILAEALSWLKSPPRNQLLPHTGAEQPGYLREPAFCTGNSFPSRLELRVVEFLENQIRIPAKHFLTNAQPFNAADPYWWVGSCEPCAWVIAHPTVSRAQFLVRPDGEGRFFVRNLGTYGTHVDGLHLQGNDEAPLQVRSSIRIGAVNLRAEFIVNPAATPGSRSRK